MDKRIKEIAEEAVRLYFQGYDAKAAIEKAKEVYGWVYYSVLWN